MTKDLEKIIRLCVFAVNENPTYLTKRIYTCESKKYCNKQFKYAGMIYCRKELVK